MNKISVVIPCIPEHYNDCLFKLIKQLVDGTRAPDEIIIALSDTDGMNIIDIASFVQRVYGELDYHDMILSLTESVAFAGTNRNRGFDVSTGNIIVFTDADDSIHPQKLEIVEYFFNQYPEAQCINHCFIEQNKEFKTYDDFTKIVVHNSDSVYDKHFPDPMNVERDMYRLWYGTWPYRIPVTNGSVSVRRQVMDRIKWTDKRKAQDRQFLYDVLLEFKQSIIIEAGLICYSKWTPGLTERFSFLRFV
jgi:glycosyltransferase involved in cell wall biosynthesis